MRILSPYSHLTDHLDTIFTDTTSLSYKTEEIIKNFCKNLTKVVNAGEAYNKLVSNSSGSRIGGDLRYLRKACKKLPRAEEKIIASIDKARSQGENLTHPSQTQIKIYQDIGKIQGLIKGADLMTLWLVAPEPSRIKIAPEKLIVAQAYLYEFINERKIFNYFSNHGHYPLNGQMYHRSNIAVNRNPPAVPRAVNRVPPSAPPAVSHDLADHFSGITVNEAPPSYEQAMRQGQNQRMNPWSGIGYANPAGQ
ncbi:hypothetical protein [Pantoea cypripedii]|nr:hypothetical protein [Pantoea cypripedii]